MSLSPVSLPLTLLPPAEGAGTSSEVTSLFDVAIAGTGYMVDWNAPTPYVHQTAPILRPQADTGSASGEQSVNPEGPWRRTQDSWHIGAGQVNADRPDSNPARFFESQGVDPWTESELTLLPDVVESLNSSATNLLSVVAGSRLYVADGQVLKYTTDPFAGTPTYTTVTGTPASDIEGLASDGTNVYIAYGANGIYETNTGSGAATSFVTGTVTQVAWVRGRLMASAGDKIYNVITAVGGGPAALPSALFDHRNDSFEFVGFTESANHIYAAGFAGDKSEIYRVTIEPDGTALGAPTQAGVLPDGEIVSSIYGYLGFVLIGTTRGVRFATPDTNGNLVIGALIETGSEVKCFEGQGRFVWFGWTAFSGSLTGLGRLDLQNFSNPDNLVPAYASDLMAAGSGAITSVATFDDKRVFGVAADGFYAESTDLVSSGYVTSSNITYGLSETKTAFDYILTGDFTDGGTIRVQISSDGSAFSPLDQSTSSGTKKISARETTGNRLQTKVFLDRNGSDTTKGPKLTAGTLRSYPRIEGTKYIVASLLMREVVEGRNGAPIPFDALGARADLDALWETQAVTTFQEYDESWSVQVSDMAWRAEPSPWGATSPYGVLEVRMKVVS